MEDTPGQAYMRRSRERREHGPRPLADSAFVSGQAIRSALDPAHFSQYHFAWEPYPYQRDVLDAVLLHGKRRICWVAGRGWARPMA